MSWFCRISIDGFGGSIAFHLKNPLGRTARFGNPAIFETWDPKFDFGAFWSLRYPPGVIYRVQLKDSRSIQCPDWSFFDTQRPAHLLHEPCKLSSMDHIEVGHWQSIFPTACFSLQEIIFIHYCESYRKLYEKHNYTVGRMKKYAPASSISPKATRDRSMIHSYQMMVRIYQRYSSK